MFIAFAVDGRPVPQPRPRVFKNGGVQTDSAKSKAQKAAILAEWSKKGEKLEGQITLTCTFQFKTKHGRKTPDLDNLVKLVMDALNGWAFADDSQIVGIDARKIQNCREDYTTIRLTNWCG